MRAFSFKELVDIIYIKLLNVSVPYVHSSELMGFNRVMLFAWALFCRLLVYYIFISLLIGFFIAIFSKRDRPDKSNHIIAYNDFAKKVKIPRKAFEAFRQNASGIFLGINKLTKKEVTLTYEQANKHTLVMGPTGVGKTSSVILPMMYHNFKKGHPCIIFDFKGSSNLELKVRALLKAADREADLLFFSLAEPARSNKYNFLVHGDATELKDKIIASKEWSEPYYKAMSESALLNIFNIFEDRNIIPTLSKVRTMLRDPKSLTLGKFNNSDVERAYHECCSHFKKDRIILSGLDSFIHSIIESKAGGLFDCETSEIDILDAFDHNKIIYFKVPSMKYHETSINIARIILADLKVACSTLQDRFTNNFKFFPVIIDEAKSIMFDGFDDFLSRARDTGISITFTTHSPSDFKTASKDLTSSIMQNVGNKVLFRLKDSTTLEAFNRSMGTYATIKYTSEVSDTAFGKLKTGRSSMREVDEFKVDPNILRNLHVGESVVIIDDVNKNQLVRHDYINPDISALKVQYSLLKSKQEGITYNDGNV